MRRQPAARAQRRALEQDADRRSCRCSPSGANPPQRAPIRTRWAAGRQPSGRTRRRLVAAVGNELQPLRARDRALGQPEWLDQHSMARPLVVEREITAIVADSDFPAIEAGPAGLTRALHGASVGSGAYGRCRLARRAIRRPQRRVARQHVLDVHQDQLLVLLLVIQAGRHKIGNLVIKLRVEQPPHRFVDMTAVSSHFGARRAGQIASLRTGVPLADGLVVRVEQEPERRVVLGVPVEMRLAQERLEEPCDVRPVPFRGADVGHRLDALVLVAQRCGERIGVRPN